MIFFRLYFFKYLTNPFMQVLSDSDAPEVKYISSGEAFIKLAIFFLLNYIIIQKLFFLINYRASSTA